MYQFLIKPILFLLKPETAHHIASFFLKRQIFIPSGIKGNQSIDLKGIKLHSRVGIAAGFDKNAEMIGGLSKLGFGFVEIGTVTPKAQDGNPKPRLFRLKPDSALINRPLFYVKEQSCRNRILNIYEENFICSTYYFFIN